jgi:protein-tyrosine-phosphatase
MHRTRPVDHRSVEEADLLLAMEVDHVVELCRRFPQYQHKVYLFGCLTDREPGDVADPVYGSGEMFDASFEQIERGVRRIVAMLPPASRSLTAEARQ